MDKLLGATQKALLVALAILASTSLLAQIIYEIS
jgi:hypothetical protein